MSALDLKELAAIPGIDHDKVKRYGRPILRLVDNARRRYQELRHDAESNGVVPDPNHHNVINLSSSDEYSDDDLFIDQASTLDLDQHMEESTEDLTSRYFPPPPSPGYDPADDFQSAPTNKSRKRPFAKRPRRKNGGSNGGSNGSWKAKGSRSKTGTGSHAPSRPSAAPRKASTKAKTPRATIGMMPV